LHVNEFGFWSWEELISHSTTTEGQVDIETARRVASGASTPDFLPNQVTSEAAHKLIINRSCIMMNSAEYKQHFGKNPPGARGPKIPTLMVPREGSAHEVEKVWCFRDPTMPHRSICVVSRRRLACHAHPSMACYTTDEQQCNFA
jgi:hypothetical protein